MSRPASYRTTMYISRDRLVGAREWPRLRLWAKEPMRTKRGKSIEYIGSGEIAFDELVDDLSGRDITDYHTFEKMFAKAPVAPGACRPVTLSQEE